MEVIDQFTGEFAYLSNFYFCDITHESKTFPSSEHLFHWFKTLDEVEKESIRTAKTSALAKKLGHKLTLRADWESVKDSIMTLIVRAKFYSHPNLAAKLLATGDAKLIEGNYWHDNHWGTCICKKCGNVGKNHLGLILMQIRDELKDNK